MNNRLLTPDELKEITGLTRYSKQVEWFKNAFGVDIVCSIDGRPIVTWMHFEALLARRAGLLPPDQQLPRQKVRLHSPFEK